PQACDGQGSCSQACRNQDCCRKDRKAGCCRAGQEAGRAQARSQEEWRRLMGAIDPFIFQLSIFVLAIFVGYFVVWSVTPALHTPLMSVTNAISSVIVVGALLAVGVNLAGEVNWTSKIFGFFALILASVNIFGGFLVTQRMLSMYKKKG